MGIKYALAHDATREGYNLSKGPWGEDGFVSALTSLDAEALASFLLDDDNMRGLGYGYTEERVRCAIPEIIAFAQTHPGWHLINDASSDIQVVDDTERAELVADFGELDHLYYRQVGSFWAPIKSQPST